MRAFAASACALFVAACGSLVPPNAEPITDGTVERIQEIWNANIVPPCGETPEVWLWIAAREKVQTECMGSRLVDGCMLTRRVNARERVFVAALANTDKNGDPVTQKTLDGLLAHEIWHALEVCAIGRATTEYVTIDGKRQHPGPQWGPVRKLAGIP